MAPLPPRQQQQQQPGREDTPKIVNEIIRYYGNRPPREAEAGEDEVPDLEREDGSIVTDEDDDDGGGGGGDKTPTQESSDQMARRSGKRPEVVVENRVRRMPSGPTGRGRGRDGGTFRGTAGMDVGSGQQAPAFVEGFWGFRGGRAATGQQPRRADDVLQRCTQPCPEMLRDRGEPDRGYSRLSPQNRQRIVEQDEESGGVDLRGYEETRSRDGN